MELHSYLLRFGLIKPTTKDILEKIIKNKISERKLKMLRDEDICVKSSISIKKETDDLIPYLIPRHGYLLKFRHEDGYFIEVGCQFIAEHLNEINNILDDIESKIESKYNEILNTRFKIIAEREQRTLQENKCLTKLWEQYR